MNDGPTFQQLTINELTEFKTIAGQNALRALIVLFGTCPICGGSLRVKMSAIDPFGDDCPCTYLTPKEYRRIGYRRE